MALDLAGALAEALADPRVGAVLGKLFKPLVAQSLAESSADSWLTAKEAARYLYGTDGKIEAFRKLRNAHSEHPDRFPSSYVALWRTERRLSAESA